MSLTATEARKRLFPLIEQVNDDREAVEIVSKGGNAYLVAAEEYEALQETAYLLRSPANAQRLMESYRAAVDGTTQERDLLDDEADAE